MSNKHTRGPWAVGYGDGVTGKRAALSVYLDGIDKSIAVPIRRGRNVVAWILSFSPDNLVDSDARLIAAAPDLLEALQVLMECRKYGPVSDEADAWIMVRAAIFKATGKQA